MRCGTAHIEVVDRGAVLGPSGDGAKEKELFQRKLALKNVALGEPEFALKIERSENLAASDDVFDVGSVFGDGVDDVVTEGFALVVPVAFSKFVRRILDKAGENVFARRRDARIGEAGNHHINVWTAGVAAVFGIVVGAFHVVHARRNGNRAAKMRALAGQAFEIGKLIESQIDFAGRAPKFVAAHPFEKITGKLAGLQEFFKRKMRVDARGDHVGENFFAALQDHAAGAAVLDQNFRDGRFGADLRAGFARGVRDSVRNRPGAAAAEAPGAERAVDFSHVVMEENVRRAGRTDAKQCADDAGGGHGGFEDISLEPLVEKIGGAHGHELDERVALIGRKFAEALQEKVKLLEVLRIERGGIGRNHRENGLHETAHGRHHLRKFIVGLGIDAGVAANVADGFGVIVHAPQIVAVRHRSKSAVERKNLQTVAREIKFTNDFRAKQRDNV